MKSLIAILLITIIGCNQNPAPTEEVPKKDSVIVVDTVARKMASRAQVGMIQVQDSVRVVTLTIAELGHTVDSLVAWRMAQNPNQDWTTARKDIGFLVGEIDRLTSESLAKSDRIAALEVRLDKFHFLWFNPDHFNAVQAEQTDSVSLKKP